MECDLQCTAAATPKRSLGAFSGYSAIILRTLAFHRIYTRKINKDCRKMEESSTNDDTSLTATRGSVSTETASTATRRRR
jgi:hypothetical protein